MHSDYHFSVKIHTNDLAVVYCVRALSKFSQKTGNNNIPWGGTKDRDWERSSHVVTFYFSSTEYRVGFLQEARRLLPAQSWQVEEEHDDIAPVR